MLALHADHQTYFLGDAFFFIHCSADSACSACSVLLHASLSHGRTCRVDVKSTCEMLAIAHRFTLHLIFIYFLKRALTRPNPLGFLGGFHVQLPVPLDLLFLSASGKTCDLPQTGQSHCGMNNFIFLC